MGKTTLAALLAAGLIATLPASGALAQYDKPDSQNRRQDRHQDRENQEAAVTRSDRRARTAEEMRRAMERSKSRRQDRERPDLAEILERVQQAPEGGRLSVKRTRVTQAAKHEGVGETLKSRRRPLSSSGTGAPRSDRVALNRSVTRTGPYDAIFDKLNVEDRKVASKTRASSSGPFSSPLFAAFFLRFAIAALLAISTWRVSHQCVRESSRTAFRLLQHNEKNSDST